MGSYVLNHQRPCVVRPGSSYFFLTTCGVILAAGVLFTSARCYGQQQLVLLRGESVVARWEVGDLIQCKLRKGEKTITRIRELHDFYLLTVSADTVWYWQISKFRVHQRVDMTRGLGGALFMGGVSFFLIDQFNTSFIVSGGPQISRPVATASLLSVALGSAILFLKPRYQKTRGRVIRQIDVSSPFFRAK